MTSYRKDPRYMTARFPSKCDGCQADIRKGERIFYYPNGHKAYGDKCGCAATQAADFEAARFDEEFA